MHVETDADGAALVKTWAARVAPGGALVIIDCVAAGTFEHEVARAFYALHLGMRTAKGGVHATARLAAWCAAAGLPQHEVVQVDGMAGLGAFVAKRDDAAPAAADKG